MSLFFIPAIVLKDAPLYIEPKILYSFAGCFKRKKIFCSLSKEFLMRVEIIINCTYQNDQKIFITG
jgi:hypothetical protein